MTSLVVDIGCADHSGKSVGYLVERFQPSELWGFDPYPEMDALDYQDGPTHVRTCKQAAWTHDGEIAYTSDGDCSHTGDGPLTVACFDLARWLGERDDGAVLKLDAEGAEYELLPRLIATDEDERLSLLLVEWHDGDHGLTDELRCPIELWPF